MKHPSKMTNEEMALHLDLWLDLDGKVESANQVDFFNEVIWRLRLMVDGLLKEENEHG